MEGGKVLPGLSERSNESVDSLTGGRLMKNENYVKLCRKMLLPGGHIEKINMVAGTKLVFA